jgi:hypothetical protein
MADQAQAQVAPTSPPTFGSDQVAVSYGPPGILLTFGLSRIGIDAGTGMPAHMGREWLATYQLNPLTAQQLVDTLQATLRQYETSFGKIPHDPAFKIAVPPPDIKK